MKLTKWHVLALIALVAAACVVAWLMVTSPKSLYIREIGLSLNVPSDLGDVSYKMDRPNSIMLYSSAYETLGASCKGRPIAHLLLTDNPGIVPGGYLDISAHSDYNYALVIGRPMGDCDGNSLRERALYGSARTMMLGRE